MKNVTITLSEDLVHVLDSLCKDSDCSRCAFAKEALLEKIERHIKTETAKVKDSTIESQRKADSQTAEREVESSKPCFIFR